MDKSSLYLSFARGEVRCITCFLPLIILPASFHFFTFSTFHLYSGGGEEGMQISRNHLFSDSILHPRQGCKRQTPTRLLGKSILNRPTRLHLRGIGSTKKELMKACLMDEGEHKEGYIGAANLLPPTQYFVKRVLKDKIIKKIKIE